MTVDVGQFRGEFNFSQGCAILKCNRSDSSDAIGKLYIGKGFAFSKYTARQCCYVGKYFNNCEVGAGMKGVRSDFCYTLGNGNRFERSAISKSGKADGCNRVGDCDAY